MHLKLQALLLLCAATLAESQAIQVPPAPAPSAAQSSATIHQTVNNVLVDVVVTDKNGQPVKGLSKVQFQVLENGAPQQIAFFEEHQAQPALAPPAHPLQLPPNVYTNIATTAPDTGPTLILLMDALNTPSADQVKVRLAMLEYLRKIPAGPRIAIFTLTSKLRMVQGFNGDPATLIAALDQVANWQKQSHLTDDRGLAEHDVADRMVLAAGPASLGLNEPDDTAAVAGYRDLMTVRQRTDVIGPARDLHLGTWNRRGSAEISNRRSALVPSASVKVRKLAAQDPAYWPTRPLRSLPVSDGKDALAC